MDAPVKHALLSPSGAHRWMACPGSVRLERGLPETAGAYAAEGTCAHALAALCLETETQAEGYIGRVFEGVEVTEDMAGYVSRYVDLVRGYATGGSLLVEQQVYIGHITQEPGGFGTSDAIIISADGRTMYVVDLKYGYKVDVAAEGNEQAQLYALGALDMVELLGYAPERICIAIIQPRLSAEPKEWELPLADLMAFGERAKARASHALAVLTEEAEGAVTYHLHAGEKQCRWCKAKATCPAAAKEVADTTLVDFDDLSQAELPAPPELDLLGRCMAKVEFVEGWCKAVRAKVEAELLAGQTVPGWKLVEGRRGARAWKDEAEAEGLLKSMRLKQDEMYTFKVISPTQAEKLLAKESPRRWTKLQALVSQTEGRPSVAPESDRRPALNRADDFEVLA